MKIPRSSLIFHTALRTLKHRMQAEDVAQRVLGVPARKASQVACENALLAAWLHRTTLLEAKSVRQSVSRRVLETLQRILSRRSITLSIGILTAGLFERPVLLYCVPSTGWRA